MGNSPDTGLGTLGQLIKVCRERSGLTQAELVKKLGYSTGWLSNVETGQLRPTREKVAQIEEELGIQRTTLTEVYDRVLRHDHPVESFERYADLEASARTIHDYEALAIPGLLQTVDTARALLVAGRPTDRPDVIDDLVERRMARQAILDKDHPPVLYVVLDETVLRRPVGGSTVHAAQLDHLVAAAERPGISVQVIPFDTGAHAGLVSTYHVLAFNDRPDIAYSEDAATGHIHERPDLVRAMTDSYDALRMSVLPSPASMDLIKKIREEI